MYSLREMTKPNEVRFEYVNFPILLARQYLLDSEVVQLEDLANHYKGVRITLQRLELANWPVSSSRLVVRSKVSKAGKTGKNRSGKCIVCGEAIGNKQTMTCRSKTCLTRWLLPGKSRDHQKQEITIQQNAAGSEPDAEENDA
jgi:hypothetical protein